LERLALVSHTEIADAGQFHVLLALSEQFGLGEARVLALLVLLELHFGLELSAVEAQ